MCDTARNFALPQEAKIIILFSEVLKSHNACSARDSVFIFHWYQWFRQLEPKPFVYSRKTALNSEILSGWDVAPFQCT